jgi:hypothetical protein
MHARLRMARGFESKGAESNRQDAEAERELRALGPQSNDIAEIERRQKRAGLELSRRRVQNELASAADERRRAQLQAALEHLEKELANEE